MRKMAANALRALLLLVGLMFALSAAGIDLTALGVLGGALGVGIGLGLQKLAANYVSGFVILAERSMRIGDMVKVDGFEGRITDITTRYTVIRALNGREAIVPNEMMITQRVENSLAGRPQGGADHGGAGGLRHRPGRADARSCSAAVAAGAAGAGRPRARRAAQQLCRRRAGADVAFWIDDPRRASWATCAPTSTWRCCAAQRGGRGDPVPAAGGAHEPSSAKAAPTSSSVVARMSAHRGR
jgi:hypothetical protein